jgi:hypothetical protein
MIHFNEALLKKTPGAEQKFRARSILIVVAYPVS